MKTISVVIPCYYSETTIGTVVKETTKELVKGGYDYEFVLVNDGSSDGTFHEIEKLCDEDHNVVGVNCSKNFGQHSALMAGLRQASGDLVMLMDDDMQTHPSQCMKLIRAIEDTGSDVVFAKWKKHKEPKWRLLGSRFATWSVTRMAHRPSDVTDSNFLVMKKYVRDEVIQYKGPFVHIQGLIFRITSNIVNEEVEHFEREQGVSGYTFKALVRMWSTVLNFSMLPLRAASFLGFLFGVSGLIAAIVVIVRKILIPTMSAGWPSLAAIMLICSGSMLICIGIVGEYLGRIFMVVNHDPQYVVKQIVDKREEQ